MGRFGRVISLAVIFVVLLGAIVLVFPVAPATPTKIASNYSPPAGANWLPVGGDWLWVGAVLLVIVVTVGGLVLRNARYLRMMGHAALLNATMRDLTVGMENYPCRGSARRNRARAALVERFTEKAAVLGQPLPLGGKGGIDFSNVALEVVERNEKDSSGHFRRVNGIRRGAHAIHILFTTGNIVAAYLLMTEHMKVQARMEPGQVPNHTELKMVLGLSTVWPTKADAEYSERRGLPLRVERDLLRLLAHPGARASVFRGVQYTPWPETEDETEVTYSGEEQLLKEMRQYIR